MHQTLQFFRYEHLPESLQAVSKPFGKLARKLAKNLPENPQKDECLRLLLAAKDAAVRAHLFKEE